MNWEIGIDMYTLICIKWITNKNLLYKKINKKQINKKENIRKKNLIWGFSKQDPVGTSEQGTDQQSTECNRVPPNA